MDATVRKKLVKQQKDLLNTADQLDPRSDEYGTCLSRAEGIEKTLRESDQAESNAKLEQEKLKQDEYSIKSKAKIDENAAQQKQEELLAERKRSKRELWGKILAAGIPGIITLIIEIIRGRNEQKKVQTYVDQIDRFEAENEDGKLANRRSEKNAEHILH